jgi:hypothetical protein
MRPNTLFRRRAVAFAVAAVVGVAIVGFQPAVSMAEGPTKAAKKPAASPASAGASTKAPDAPAPTEKKQQPDLERTKAGRQVTPDDKAAAAPPVERPTASPATHMDDRSADTTTRYGGMQFSGSGSMDPIK